jgi:D-alanyl-D-alanine-carboxypeptidase/D-alanyl-D-alanine-endopeptidase
MNCRRTLLVLSVWLATVAPASRADHAAEIDRLVQPLVEGKSIVGCVVGVIDGDAREVHGYGETAVGSGQRPDGRTEYEIGSITKALTGTLLADMVLRGEVRLDQPIAELLPEGVTPPAFAADQPITLLQLATHTSGLPRLPDNMEPKDPANPYDGYGEEQMGAFLNKHKLRRAAGTYEYSNFGAGLLGTLLARKAGKTYEELLEERLTAPVGMTDTRLVLSPDQSQRLAPPYAFGLQPYKNWDFDVFAGAGGVRSTVDDMLKLLAAAMSDADAPAVKALKLAGEQRHGAPGEIGVGLGWHLARDGVSRWHNGQTGGYSSFIGYIPERRLAVAVLCNTATDTTTVLGERVLQSLAGMKVDPPKTRREVVVDVTQLEKYVGVYQLAPFFAITVTLENGQLMAQASRQDKHPIFAESPTQFFYEVVDAQLTFEVDADGKPTKLILHQNGADVPGVRVESKP